MSIDSKYAYRFGFLQSEEWKTMRLVCLAMDEGKCVVCGKYDPSNDAHHLFYRETWYKTKPQDLLTLCRECHQKVHSLGEDITAKELWKQYQTLPKKVLSGCYICNSESSLELFTEAGDADSHPNLCVECTARVRLEMASGDGHPWKHVRVVKDRFRVRQVRDFHAANLSRMISVGLDRQFNRDFFKRALGQAQKKIRKYLLTLSAQVD